MSQLKLTVVEENLKLPAQTSKNDLGGKFSHIDGKPGVSGFRIFGCYFFGQNGTPPFVMGRGYPPPPESRIQSCSYSKHHTHQINKYRLVPKGPNLKALKTNLQILNTHTHTNQKRNN